MRKGKRLSLDALAPFTLDLPDPPAFLEWNVIFGDDHPVELEVGFGKGAFLVMAGQEHADVNYVGVEVDRGLQLYTATRLAKRQLSNVRVAKADARPFVRDFIASSSLSAVHVYFPDPWWKKRHKKRRVFTEEFARECERVLIPGGRLHLATDVEEYFEVMTALVEAHTRLKADPAFGDAGEDGLTNFEKKAKERGRPVWRAVYRA